MLSEARRLFNEYWEHDFVPTFLDGKSMQILSRIVILMRPD
jgi:hypothetical protein